MSKTTMYYAFLRPQPCMILDAVTLCNTARLETSKILKAAFLIIGAHS